MAAASLDQNFTEELSAIEQCEFSLSSQPVDLFELLRASCS